MNSSIELFFKILLSKFKIYIIVVFLFLLPFSVCFSYEDSSSEININSVNSFLWIQLLIFLSFSAFFSCSETAIFSLSKIQIMKIETLKNFGSNTLKYLLSNPKTTLTTILLGNLFVNIGASLTGGIIAERYIQHDPILSFFIGFISITLLILFFGEIIPKTLGLEKAEVIARYFAPLIKTIYIILLPLNRILSYIINLSFKILNIPPLNLQNTLTEEELKSLLQLSDVRAVLEDDEKEMIESVIEFRETTAEDIMTPRTDIVAFDINTPREEINNYFKSKGHKRVPVFEEDMDHIAGILLAKDIIVYPEKDIKELLREPIYIPIKKPVSQLLNEFRQKTLHIAVVIDEFGGTAGIVTLNDILEEIVGEMKDKARDQKTEAEQNIIKNPNNESYKVLGKTEIWEFEEKFKTALPQDMGRTIGGIVMNSLGKLPKEGETIEFDFGVFTVTKMIENRIHELIFTPSKITNKEEEEQK